MVNAEWVCKLVSSFTLTIDYWLTNKQTFYAKKLFQNRNQKFMAL
jgi:hypothetical protein